MKGEGVKYRAVREGSKVFCILRVSSQILFYKMLSYTSLCSAMYYLLLLATMATRGYGLI